MLSVEFGIGAINAGLTDDQMVPAAVVPVVKFGLARTNKEGKLSVDAAKVKR